MLLTPPISTRTVPLFSYPTLFRSSELPSTRVRGLAASSLVVRAWVISCWFVTFDFTSEFQTAGKKGSMRSEEHTSELQSLMRISYAVFCLKKKKNYTHYTK